MVSSSSESPAVSLRTSGGGGSSHRGGIHAVIRRLSDAPDSRSMPSDPSKGVSPRVETHAKMLLHASSEASGTVEAERVHPSTFKPGPRLNTTALAAHQHSAALQSSRSSLTQGCERAPRSCTEPCHLDEEALTSKTPDVHTSTKTQSLDTPPGCPEVAASSASMQLHLDRNGGGQNPQQTTAARPTVVSQTTPTFSDNLRSALAPTIRHPVPSVQHAAKQGSSMPHKQDGRHVPPVAAQQLLTPASLCTSEVGSHAMMVSSTAPVVSEATVADSAHPVPTPRYVSAAQATQARPGPSVIQTYIASDAHGDSMDDCGHTDCQPTAPRTRTVATANGPVMPHPHRGADPASNSRGLRMPQQVAAAGDGVDGEELMQSRRGSCDPIPQSSESLSPKCRGYASSPKGGTSALQEDFVPGRVPASPDAQLPILNVPVEGSYDTHSSAGVEDASSAEAEQLSPCDEPSSPQNSSRIAAAVNLEGLSCETPLGSGQGFTDFALAAGSNVQHDPAGPIEAQAGSWHAVVPAYESDCSISGSTGACLAAFKEGMTSLSGGRQASSTNLPPVTEHQTSFFNGAGVATEQGLGSAWASTAARNGVQSIPRAATFSQGVTEGGFGSSINLPSVHSHYGTSDQSHSCWGSDTVISGPSQGRVERSEHAAESGQRSAWAGPQAVPHGDTGQKAEGWCGQSSYKPAEGSTADTHKAIVPPAILSMWPENYSCVVPSGTSGTTASGRFFEEVGLGQCPADAGNAAGATGTQPGQNPGADSGRFRPDNVAPELTTGPPGSPYMENTCAAQAQDSEALPYWCEEWGFWLSACGQYYYDEATGTWPLLYPAEPASFEGWTDQQRGSQGTCDADQGDSRHGLAVDADASLDTSAQVGVQADACRDEAGPSFFDSIMQDGGAFLAMGASGSQPQDQGQSTCTPSFALVPHVSTLGVSGVHGNGHSAGSVAAGVGSGAPAESATWPATPSHPLAESHDASRTEPGGVAAACTYGTGKRFFDCKRRDSSQQASCDTRAVDGGQDGAGLCHLLPPQSADVAASGSGLPCPETWGGHAHGVLSTLSPTPLAHKDEQHAARTTQARTQQPPYQQYYMEHAMTPQSSDPPRSLMQAMYSNVGRPPRSFAVFGFGGRCCLFQLPPAAPGYSEAYTASSAYMLSVLASRFLQRFLASGADEDAAADPWRDKRSIKKWPASVAVAELQDWPGPMMQTAPAAKVLAAAVDRRAAAAADRGKDALALLWRLLLVMAKHKGAVQDSKQGAPEAAILALVKQALVISTDVNEACIMGAKQLQQWAAHMPNAADVSKIEELLMDGNRDAALAAATKAQAWPIALAVAQFSGPDRLHGTLRKLLDDALLPGSAIHIFSLLASQSFESVAVSMQASAAGVGNPDRYALLATQATIPVTLRTEANTMPATHASPTRAPAAAGPDMPVAEVQQQTPGDGPAAQQVNLHGQAPQGCQSMRDSNWRKSLLMLVANRSAGDMPALAALGDDLWAARLPQLWQYAHVCYILAGKLLGSAADPSCTFVVPGVDHTLAMGACGRIDSLQRIELLAWCHMQCHGMPMYCVIPSYIMYAGRLAEEGLIADALAYAAAALALASKFKADRHLPVQTVDINLLAAFSQDLLDRLKAHSAAIGASGTRSGQSVVSRVGSFLDRSVMRMLGTDSPSPSPAEMSKSASAASLTSLAPAPRHQTGASHARHPSFDSESQNMTAAAPSSGQCMNAAQPAVPYRGLQAPSPVHRTPLLNTMHAAHVRHGQDPVAVAGSNGPRNKTDDGYGSMAGQIKPAVQLPLPAPSYQQQSQRPWLPPSVPARGNVAAHSAVEPSKSWLGGIAAKLLPRVSSGFHKDEASSSQKQSSAPGEPSNQARLIRPPLYPQHNSFPTAHLHQNLQNPSANDPEIQRVAGSAETPSRRVLHGPPGAYMPHPQIHWASYAPPTPSKQYLP